MAGFLANTITKYTKRTVDSYIVSDYKSIDINAIYDYINGLPKTTFDWYQVQDNDKWERISLELYNNADYWDILLIVNQRDTLLGLPFSFDIIAQLSEDLIHEYEIDAFGSSVPSAERTSMYNSVEAFNTEENETKRVIKIIKPTEMNRFLQDGYDLGIF